MGRILPLLCCIFFLANPVFAAALQSFCPKLEDTISEAPCHSEPQLVVAPEVPSFQKNTNAACPLWEISLAVQSQKNLVKPKFEMRMFWQEVPLLHTFAFVQPSFSSRLSEEPIRPLELPTYLSTKRIRV